MSAFGKLALGATIVFAWSTTAHAGDPRCYKPPYGGSPDRYRGIEETYRQTLDSVAKTLEEICNMKFGGADRAALHQLGFTDDAIDARDTTVLAVEMFQAVKDRASSK